MELVIIGTHHRWKHCTYDETMKLVTYNDDGEGKEVHHCHIDMAHKTLEVMISHNGNDISQISRMHQISTKFRDRVHVGLIRGYDIFHTLNSAVMRS